MVMKRGRGIQRRERRVIIGGDVSMEISPHLESTP